MTARRATCDQVSRWAYLLMGAIGFTAAALITRESVLSNRAEDLVFAVAVAIVSALIFTLGVMLNSSFVLNAELHPMHARLRD